MLYPLGWLPPEAPNSPDAKGPYGPVPTVNRLNPKQIRLEQSSRANRQLPKPQLIAGRPALSDRTSVAQVSVGVDPPGSSANDKTLPATQFGDRGKTVHVIQARLQAKNYYLGPLDGLFGPLTAEAVRTFQRDQAITVDGIVGPITWQRLRAGDAGSLAVPISPTGAKQALPSQPPAGKSMPMASMLHHGPVFTPALVPRLSFHPIEVSPVEGSPKLLWVTILTLAVVGGAALCFKPDSKAFQPSHSPALPQQTRARTVHRPQPIYPGSQRVAQTKVIHRPQPVYSPGHGTPPLPAPPIVKARPGQGSASPVLPPTLEAELHHDLQQLIRNSPWATQTLEDYLTGFLYDLQEAHSRQQLEGLVAPATADSEPVSPVAAPPATTPLPLHRLGTFPERNQSTGKAYTYMLLDDMGGCFRLCHNELWLTEVATRWLTDDEFYTLTIRRVDTTGRTIDRAFTVKLNTYQMQMAS